MALLSTRDALDNETPDNERHPIDFPSLYSVPPEVAGRVFVQAATNLTSLQHEEIPQGFDYRDVQLPVLGAGAFFQSVSSPPRDILGSVVQRGTYGFESQGIEV